MAKAKAANDSLPEEADIARKFNQFKELTEPVIELYSKFGKVRTIDTSGHVNQVYGETKSALLPEIYCFIGPKASGKTAVGTKLAEKTNMEVLNFHSFLKDNYLCQ